MSIISKVKNFEDACQVLGIEPKIPDFSFLDKIEEKAQIAHFKLIIIIKALNEGWKPDWSNGKWDKWFPWFWFDNDNGSSSSGRFSFDVSVHLCTASACGSRLCLKSEELADYVGQEFIELYKDYYVIE